MAGWQAPGNQTGIPQWLEQFLNSQGGIQGLLYQVGGIQGLLSLIQQQSQQPSRGKPTPQPGTPGDPFGWTDWLKENHQPAAWQPGEKFSGTLNFANPGSAKGVNPYYTQGLPKLSNVSDWSRTLSPEDINTLRNIDPNLRGQDLFNALPASIQATTAPGQTNYGLLNSGFPVSGWTGVRGPAAEAPAPMGKYDYATSHGYGKPGAGQAGKTPDFGNILQTLKGAGWDPSKGYGPQTFTRPAGGAALGDKQQTMLNDLLYSISPRSRPRSEYDYMKSGMSRAEWLKEREERNKLPKAPDPFEGLQSAINRDAYVNETLGGGFYGGIIPDEDALNTYGGRRTGGEHDPHFPTPQLALNPLSGQKYDTYAGWAADQGAAFGTAPWASDSMWGQSMGYDDPTKYQQPPAPTTAWQPTPQFGQNAWGGTKGWGNTSRNQQNNAWGNSSTQTQQQPMAFGVSPWDNPWGMT